MKRPVFILILAFAGIFTQAQIPNGYYNNATGKTGDELKTALHNIIKGHTTISYAQIWNAFWSTDNKGNGVVWDMYSDIPGGTPPPPYTYQLGQNQCGSYDGEGDCYNREHSWAQSWFSNASTPTTDLHHIFATDGYVNQQRGNYPYGEVGSGSGTTTFQNGSKLGKCKSSLGYTGKVFEPIDAYKGDFARALMYVSVRYYTEDGSWGTSGMTNKSVIEPWAIAMLMDWNDQDPVSQKEIDRNNAIYKDYQHNRNPFIDHPEYARMIWDDNYTPTTSYSITYADNLLNGSVSGPATAAEGSTVSITATPAAGYQVGSFSVYKTGSPSTTVTVSSDGTFTMPGYAVTVSATFTVNNTLYDIALGSVSHGTISASTSSAKSGTTINLTATPASGYSLYSWYVYKTGDMSTRVTVTGNSFVMPAFNVTVTATFVQGSANGNYVKVTSAPSNGDWSGEYILVYESSTTQGLVWTGTADHDCYISSTISNGSIASNNGFIALVIESYQDGYSIKLIGPNNNGKYISGTSGSNAVNFGTNPLVNAISFESDGVKIVSNTSVMRYNNSERWFKYYKSSTYTNQKAIQLYKKETTTPTHTIQFNNNGGSGTMNNQTVNEMEAATLTANTFTREGFEFDGWNTQADGQGQYYADQATVYLTDNITLYAQWNRKYSITLVQTANGTIAANPTSAVEETAITLTATPNTGYEFDHWTVTDANDNAITVIENQFEMPASNVTVSATFVYVGEPFVQKYHLVTSTDQLVTGRTYLIVNTTARKALGTTQNGNNRSAASVTISSNVISSFGNDVCELTLGGQSGAWTFFDDGWGNNGGYLYAAGGTGNNNYLRTQATLPDEGKWTISLDNNSNATIKTIVTTVLRHTIMYNSGSTIFSCYASNQQPVQLFIRSEEYDHTENGTVNNLFAFDKHVIAPGTTLSVTGTATCNDPSNLIIEDGAQFIHHNDNVKATFKKDIDAYTTNGGWYTIATPFTLVTPAGTLISEIFDLYSYVENGNNEGKEWFNYRAHSDNFTMTPSNGYLYAHNPGVTHRITGTLNNGDYCPTVDLSYSNTNEIIKGYNLLGNPTAHDITFTKSGSVSDGYYYLSNSETWVFEPSYTVPVGRGFLVKANDSGQTVTLNPQSRRGETPGSYLCININDDKAYVKMDEGVSMPLFALNGKSSNLYLTRDGKPYIMLVREDANNIDLNFKASENGTHTLTISETANYQLPTANYLHLIDNLTGADIDLLATPSYTFEAKTNDYASRFKLVFNADANENNNEDGDFVFISHGNIIINGTGTLQIIDALGRTTTTKELSTANCQLPTTNFKSGVYVLRLVTPEKTRIQKIAIY